MEYVAKVKKLGIVRITPTFLEVGQSWFKKNNHLIQSQAKNQFSWWYNNYKEIEIDERISISVFSRMLADWHYQKITNLTSPGEYSVRGGIIDIFPINSPIAYRIEFSSNTIETIIPLEKIKTDPNKKISKTITKPPTQRIKIQKKDIKEYEDLISSIKRDSYVVHINHGIGIFRGIKQIKDTQYLVIEYAKKDTLRVPVSTIGRITAYIGFSNPTLTRLGGNLWEKTKKKVKEDLIEVARELLQIYAKRELSHKNPYKSDHKLTMEVEDSFEFTETIDQARAISAVYKDLEKDRPMDRVIVADVGFGKTEVALRAASYAVESGYQVALIAPTTILAHQHHKTFLQRFSKVDMPVKIKKLTRIESAKEQKQVLQQISTSQVDIVIGTHRLLQKDIKFANLGLLIIDEEQRFGVKQKDFLKSYRANIDILSLSATPIPRTLSSAMQQIRDLSIINTPPKGRIPIKTFVKPLNDKIIKQAIEKELKRKGQVYYLHNRILSLDRTLKNVQKLAPSANIQVLHAKLPEQQIIKIIDDFSEGKIDILISTTIMENGLDMARANTLIVENSAKLGLAQLHQIRGRIGRSELQAYAYLLYPARQSLNERALMRLETLESYQNLGAGYDISLKDLEIRGAGNLLGRAQSGNIMKIGFNLYCQLLNETVDQLREQQK